MLIAASEGVSSFVIATFVIVGTNAGHFVPPAQRDGDGLVRGLCRKTGSESGADLMGKREERDSIGSDSHRSGGKMRGFLPAFGA